MENPRCSYSGYICVNARVIIIYDLLRYRTLEVFVSFENIIIIVPNYCLVVERGDGISIIRSIPAFYVLGSVIFKILGSPEKLRLSSEAKLLFSYLYVHTLSPACNTKCCIQYGFNN